jgi:hypothetical protein
MAAQLDILALEPFYNAPRRAMLEVLQRYSRHRWSLLKLPPRKIERRLSAGANWFAEHLVQHFSGNIDLVFTSDAMNLTSLQRLVPELASKPAVVYFHENYLPEVMSRREGPLDLVNLSSAIVAKEIWFNSHYHQREFLKRAASLVARHPELAENDPIPSILSKASVAPPPTDLSLPGTLLAAPPDRREDLILVDTRDADIKLLNDGLEILASRRKFRLITVGSILGLSSRWNRTPIRETDVDAQSRAVFTSSLFLSAKPNANHDHLFVRAALAGCRVVAPASGAYVELAPDSLRSCSLYLPNPNDLAQRAFEQLESTQDRQSDAADWRKKFAALEPIGACRRIDERFEKLAALRVSAA